MTCSAPTPGLPGRGAKTPGGVRFSAEYLEALRGAYSEGWEKGRRFAADRTKPMGGSLRPERSYGEERQPLEGRRTPREDRARPTASAVRRQRTFAERKARKAGENPGRLWSSGLLEPTPGGKDGREVQSMLREGKTS